MELLEKIAPLFDGWNESLIWSVLQGHMGYAIADNDETPTAAQAVLGDYCFFAGKASASFAAKAAATEIVPRDESWQQAIENAWGERVEKMYRYAIKKEPGVFSRETLERYIEKLPKGYELQMFDAAIYEQAVSESWSASFRGCFKDTADFLARGVGVAALYEGKLVAGATSYSVYSGGFEIEIITHRDHREQGLATACGATLILYALSHGFYPSWDAFDRRSVALAEKLGYHLDHPYVMYMVK